MILHTVTITGPLSAEHARRVDEAMRLCGAVRVRRSMDPATTIGEFNRDEGARRCMTVLETVTTDWDDAGSIVQGTREATT